MLSPKSGTSGVHDGANVGLLEAVGNPVGAGVGSLVVGSEVVGVWLVGDDVTGAEDIGAKVGDEETGALVAQSPSHLSMLQKLDGQSIDMSCHVPVPIPSAMLST